MPLDASVDAATLRVRSRYGARRVLWSESAHKRVRECGRTSIAPGGSIVLRVSAAAGDAPASAGYAGLSSCGSVWSCPVCSAKVASVRQREVAEGIRTWQDWGGDVVMVTLTMRHHKSQSVGLLWDGLSSGWDRITRRGAEDRKAFRVGGSVRVVEVTHGANGWHLHVHALVFISGRLRAGQMSALGLSMFRLWSEGVTTAKSKTGQPLGISAPSAGRGGLDVRMVAGPDPLGSYFTKQTYATRAALEATRSDLKRARGNNRTPFTILADVVDQGDADDLDLWHDYERASKGRRQLQWSKGFRDVLGIGKGQTDEEISSIDHGGHDVVLIPAESREKLWHAGLEVALLELAREDPANAPARARAWLDERGLIWCDPPPSRPDPGTWARAANDHGTLF
jgi:hypothetical protein